MAKVCGKREEELAFLSLPQLLSDKEINQIAPENQIERQSDDPLRQKNLERFAVGGDDICLEQKAQLYIDRSKKIRTDAHQFLLQGEADEVFPSNAPDVSSVGSPLIIKTRSGPQDDYNNGDGKQCFKYDQQKTGPLFIVLSNPFVDKNIQKSAEQDEPDRTGDSEQNSGHIVGVPHDMDHLALKEREDPEQQETGAKKADEDGGAPDPRLMEKKVGEQEENTDPDSGKSTVAVRSNDRHKPDRAEGAVEQRVS